MRDKTMPESWNPRVYEARAERWREAAAVLPPGRTRDAYLALAEGYEKLAKLIALEKSGADRL
jgi:hypothetical protein